MAKKDTSTSATPMTTQETVGTEEEQYQPATPATGGEIIARRNELRLRLALESAYMISFEWNIKRNEVRRYVSTAPGLPPTAESKPSTLEAVCEVVHPDDRQAFITAVHAALAHTDGFYENEFRIIQPDGSIAWLHESGRVEFDSEGQPEYLIGLSQDISKRKCVEDRLKESEERLRLFIQHAPTGIAMFDREMRYLAVSNRWKQDFQLPVSMSLIGLSHYEVFPDIPDRWKDIHRQGMNGEILCAEEDPFVREDGSLQWIKWELFPWKTSNGQIGGILIAAEEITEQVEAKQALKESREDLNRAQAVGQIGSWRLDVQRNVLNWSDENFHIFGVPQGTPLTYESFIEVVHPEDRAYVDQQWKAGLTGEPYDIEHRLLVNGQVKWVREKAYLEVDETDTLLGGFGITQDITQRKLAELALQEANQRKDEFLAMLAHELRNPLAPISNAFQILNRTQTGNPVVKKATDLIGRQVAQLRRLVDDLLDVSRISRGKVELKKTPLELADVVHNAVETSQPLIEARGHQLNVKLPLQAIRVDGDAARLTQMISNLLNNAAKYTDAGGVLSLSLEQQPTENGIEAVIRVVDSGRGLEPAELANLFEMFYQVEQTLDRSQGGLGIGLYLVKCLVGMHGGHIEALSQGRGTGSEFVIHLPCLPEQQEKDATEIMDDDAKLTQNKRILLVDDNPDVADSMNMLLELFGYEVILARDGEDALAKALREKPDAVLLDIGLPKLNGYEVCQAIRAAGLHHTLIVAMTGYGQEEDRLKAEEAGFNQHMAKPVDVQELETLLAAL